MRRRLRPFVPLVSNMEISKLDVAAEHSPKDPGSFSFKHACYFSWARDDQTKIDQAKIMNIGRWPLWYLLLTWLGVLIGAIVLLVSVAHARSGVPLFFLAPTSLRRAKELTAIILQHSPAIGLLFAAFLVAATVITVFWCTAKLRI